ncbi:MAG: thymidylate synthase [Patescibacteria group bacterium]
MISHEQLYQPDKYKIILGEGKNIGFCTVWNEPERALKEYPELIKRSAIIGTLYSRQGVNIILRNLALNPQIRNLYLWVNGALSCSPFGVSGKEVLMKIWENGVNDNREIPGTDFKIEKEIDHKVVNSIRENVVLKEVPDSDLNAVIKQFSEENSSPYMEPVRFADAVPEVIDVFPSEKVGFLVRGKTVIDAWTRVVDRIMRYGTVKGTQYGTKQRELIGVTWVVETEDPDNPNMNVDWPESLMRTIGLNKDAIEHYRSVFLSPEAPEGVSYTYGNRLMRYPNNGTTIDQLEEVILKELKSSPDTRRAAATTMVPSIDKDSKEPPCITQIQVLQNNGKLHLLVTVRSHDIFKAAIPNAFGLRALQAKIAKEAGFEMGYLQITSQSAHIYESDWEDAKKLARCAIWEREPSMFFDPAVSADPRGLFVISVKDNIISAYFKTPSGDDLLVVSGKTAREVSLKIANLELINRPDHLLDIGHELQKAEIAISQGLAYTQDKPLPFGAKT